MLKRIISINNIGRFENQSDIGSCEFSKSNLVYGENGKGKSTLTAILRSNNENQPKYITSRKTLGSTGDAKIKLLFQSLSQNSSQTAVEFDGSRWSSNPQKFIIFDQDFIDNNIFIGGQVNYSQKCGLYQIFVGKKTGITLKKIYNADEEIRKINTQLFQLKTKIQASIKSKISIEQFLELEKLKPEENLIVSLQTQLAAITNKSEILKAPDQQIILYQAPNLSQLGTILEKSVQTISEKVTISVKAKLDIIEDIDAEVWLEQGHKYTHN
ncbi:MAG TPA: AAA family ATPase, partial [Candidatus Woesebacteria bacterium]|nr:AAA family ATPase [Candidatus Woesebacteria bacterium]